MPLEHNISDLITILQMYEFMFLQNYRKKFVVKYPLNNNKAQRKERSVEAFMRSVFNGVYMYFS